MNNKRRRQLSRLQDEVARIMDEIESAEPNALMPTLQQCADRLEGIASDLDLICEDEQEAIDNCPENLLDSPAQELRENAVDNMTAAIDLLYDITSEIGDMLEDFDADDDCSQIIDELNDVVATIDETIV